MEINICINKESEDWSTPYWYLVVMLYESQKNIVLLCLLEKHQRSFSFFLHALVPVT